MPKKKRSDTPIFQFDLIQLMMKKAPQAEAITELLGSMGKLTLEYLEKLERRTLATSIRAKHYFSFLDKNEASSRAVNAELFNTDEHLIDKFINSVKEQTITSSLSSTEITRTCYTLVMSLACTVDLINPGDRQTPGTYFQYLVTHLLTRTANALPSERIQVKIGEDKVFLTMDLILNRGKGKPKYHVAIKNSTRERGSEFWAHQRILDEAFKDEKYLGLFFGLAETKLDHTTFEVTEICVPDQWRAYQQYVAKID